jgi:hypothetical protein
MTLLQAQTPGSIITNTPPVMEVIRMSRITMHDLRA